MASSPPTFSIVLCTRNRAALLGRALESLLGIDYPAERFELVLVDNASSDDTAQVAAAFARRAPFAVRVHREPRLGLSAARNRGIAEARGRYLFFTDDDQLVDPAVLREHERVAEHYGVRVLQGGIELSFPDGRPRWLRGELETILGKTRAAPEGPLAIDLYGGNMCFRREVFDELAAFREDLGKGQAGYSEDIEITRRLERLGEPIAYAPTARIFHVIERDRASREFFVRNSFEKGRSDGMLAAASGGWLATPARAGRAVLIEAGRAAWYAARGNEHRTVLAHTRAANALGRLLGWWRAHFGQAGRSDRP